LGSAQINDLTVGGLTNHNLILDGTEGVSSTFTVRANYDWKIIDYKGFTCDPSSGPKTEMGEMITVTATPLKANNSADTIKLSALNFKLLSTRFVGISAYQLPQIRFPKGNIATLGSHSGASSTLQFVTNAEDVEITTSGDISATLGPKKNNNEYTVTITTSTDNTSIDEQLVGSVGFVVNGVAQKSKIDVVQSAAIKIDRKKVLLPYKGGVSNIIEVESDFDINISTDSKRFTVTKSSGKIYSVTANSDNTTGAELNLGTIEISLADTPDCKSYIEVWQRKGQASQTIFVNFIGTALNFYFNENINKMLEALDKDIQGDAQVMVLMTDSTTDGTLYELRYDSELGKAVKEKVREIELPTPYDGALFENNLREALTFAPAEKYAMIIGSHGLAWIPKDSAINPSSLMRYGLQPSQFWVREEGTEMTRHIGDKVPTRYNVDEVKSAIEANNIKLEYLLFDACFMGNIESAYILRNVTKTIIGSPCEVMGFGFPYAQVMPYMLANDGADYIIDKICSGYVEYYRTSAATPSACVAAINTAELENLAAATMAVNASIRNNLATQILTIVGSTEEIATKINNHIALLDASGSSIYEIKNLHTSLLKTISNIKEMVADSKNDECTVGYSAIRYYSVINSTLSQILSKVETKTEVDYKALSESINSFLDLLENESEDIKYISKVQYYEGQEPHSFYDMGDLYRLSRANGDVLAAFKTQLDKTVTSRYHTPQFYSAYGSGDHYHNINYYSGISTSSMVEHYALDWAKTDWYKATH
jgi:hypothetical protein